MNILGMEVTQDQMGTHLDWTHEGITPKMIDWFWSNMEKSFLLWHPAQHEPLIWAKAPVHGNPVGSIHIAPQTWNDGTRQNLYIRFENVADLPEKVKEYIIYEHVVVVAGLGLGEEALKTKSEDVMGYRIHQWQKTDFGVVGKSSAIGNKKIETPAEGITWAEHCAEEVGNWGVFLADIYNLFKVVKNTNYNPYADLTVEKNGKDVTYKYIDVTK